MAERKTCSVCTVKDLTLPPIPTIKQYLAERDARLVSLSIKNGYYIHD